MNANTEYIRDMLKEIGELAEAENLEVVVYLLRMARLEIANLYGEHGPNCCR